MNDQAERDAAEIERLQNNILSHLDEIERLRASNAELLAALKGCIAPVAWGVGDIPISEYPTIVDTKRALANARAVIARALEKESGNEQVPEQT